MRHTLPVLALMLFNLSCAELFADQGSPIEGCHGGKHPLYGSWQWVQSKSGWTNDIVTPASVGHTRKACFSADQTFAFYEADTLTVAGTFSIIEERSVSIIRYETESDRWLPDHKIVFKDADALVLISQCMDCPSDAYKRIRW